MVAARRLPRSGVVRTVGSPPSRRHPPRPVLGSSVANTIVLSSPQLAPSDLPTTRPERDDRSPRDRHLLELRALEEPDPPAVGGKERRVRALVIPGSGAVELIDRAHHQRAAGVPVPPARYTMCRPSGERATSRSELYTFSGCAGGGTIAKRDGSTGATGTGRIMAHATSRDHRAAGQRRDRHRCDATGRRRRTRAVACTAGAISASSISSRASAMSCRRRFGIFLEASAATDVECLAASSGQRRPVGLAFEDRGDGVGSGLAGERRAAGQHFVAARSRTPRCRSVCRPAVPAPVRGSCRRRCRG